MSPKEERGTGSLRLWRESLQPGDPAGGGRRPEEPRRRCHAARGADNRHPPAGTLPRAPGRPRSPSRGGRAHSGDRGTGNDARPARRSSRSNLGTSAPGKKPLRPEQGRQKQFRTLRAAPDVLLRQQRPYGSTSTDKGPPTSVRPAPVPPTPAGGGAPNPGQET